MCKVWRQFVEKGQDVDGGIYHGRACSCCMLFLSEHFNTPVINLAE